MGNYIIDQSSVNQIHNFFRKAILKDSDQELENVYIGPDQVKKIKAEISRLKIIIRECPDQREFYQEMIDFLQSKIKSE